MLRFTEEKKLNIYIQFNFFELLLYSSWGLRLKLKILYAAIYLFYVKNFECNDC